VELKNVSVQEVKGSYFIYIPKIWAKQMGLKQGSKMQWILDEGNHETLRLKKEIEAKKNVKKS
jgi:bifunctional DNA-binding transcriptional regulator/antitoxin component of YhaV-PrlF toxin-antitoxin module